MRYNKGFLSLILIVVMCAAAVAYSPMNRQQVLAQQNQTSEEQNKKLVLDIQKMGLNKEEEYQQFLADAKIHGTIVDKNRLKNLTADFIRAFPDIKATPELIVAEGDLVAVLWNFNGTHQGEYLEIPATGEPVTLRIVEFMRISNGEITDYWNIPDATDLLIDIGYLVHSNATNTTTTTQ